jgi:endonuclease III
MTLGSLFDGIAGFPLAAERQGIKTIWTSEIEANCTDIAKRHFPDAENLGDITKINGGNIPAVDIISFGSPCQDLSVAGEQKGLDGARSGLFMEAVRIVREMRKKTNGQYPKYIIWENVAGAFSSNKGEDFRRVLEEITETAQGIRILRQDPWETIASFIISQRNNIPRIKGTIERLCQVYGQGIPYNGSLVYTFPTPEAIANAPKEELEALGAYYRAEYLIEAARNHQGRTDAGAAADREEAYKTLTGFLGIGPKVANCICLFGLHFTEAFPRDTWISRIEENHYHGHFPVHKYPGTAGIMQQYMFYYERMQQGKI